MVVMNLYLAIVFLRGKRGIVRICFGKNLATLEASSKGAGEYNLNFSAAKQGYSEGIYFIKLTIGQETKTIKLVELK